VDAERFRVDLKDQRQEIDRLRQWFIAETYEPKRTYRPTLIGLAVISDARAKELLALTDRVLAYVASEYEKQPGRQITLREVSDALQVPQEATGRALALVNESRILESQHRLSGASRLVRHPQ